MTTELDKALERTEDMETVATWSDTFSEIEQAARNWNELKREVVPIVQEYERYKVEYGVSHYNAQERIEILERVLQAIQAAPDIIKEIEGEK